MYKKFDLEAAKNGAPVVSEDGDIGRVICSDKKGLHPVVVLFDCGCEEGIAYYHADGTSDSYASLFMAPVKKNGWINIYPDEGSGIGVYVGSSVFASKEEADEGANITRRIACIEIEWNE